MGGLRTAAGTQLPEETAEFSAAKLRETNRLLLMAEKLANLGHWRIDIGGGFVERSGQANDILGLAAEDELTPAAALDMIDVEDRPRLLRGIVRAWRGDPEILCRAKLRRTDGAHRDILLQLQADTKGECGDALFGVVRDITAKVAAEAKLISARDDAQAATRAKSEFLATMSHEIRTPMTGVMGMIDLLGSNPTEEERCRYLGAMKRSAELLMAVLDGILDFSKAESGKIELHCRDFDMEALAGGVVDMFQNAASKKGLTFDLTVSTGASPIVYGDPVRLQQVISNLISNAVKFTHEGRIGLSLQARPRGNDRQLWRVEVKDTGIGIDEEALKRLFEPFVQLGDRRFGGTGLGLAISRRLIEAMAGRSGVRSRPGRGSAFWFEVELPVGALTDKEPEEPAGLGHQAPLHVLIAEDNAINQLLVAALVRRLGHRVTCVDNGRRALEAAQAVPFDCVLMDMQMPEMDGLAATRAIRAAGGRNALVPIIALTADAAPERRRFYENVGLTDFMTKPVSIEALQRHLAPVRHLPGTSSSDRQPPQTAMDAERVAELRELLGEKKVETLLTLLATELRDRPTSLRKALASGDLPSVRSQAHSLKGAISTFGGHGVACAAKAVELALPGAELDLAMDRLDAEITYFRSALDLFAGPAPEAAHRSA